MDEPEGPVEPVSWRARLQRVPGVRYTEVDGTPCLVRPSKGAIHPLTPTWAAIWAQLDGRPVTEALAFDPAAAPRLDGRNLLEVLRRLKAMGVVMDVPRSDGPVVLEALDQAEPTGASLRLVVQGTIVDPRRAPILQISSSSASSVKVQLAEIDGRVRITFRRRLRTRLIDRVEVLPDSDSDVPPDTLERFAEIVDAVAADTDWSSVLVDRVAAIAEIAATPASPGP